MIHHQHLPASLMKTLCGFLLLISLGFSAPAQTNQTGKRLLVVSGGGARGAWGEGLSLYLDSQGNRYAMAVGTSTGALMAPLILLREHEKLITAYTSVKQGDIFNKLQL